MSEALESITAADMEKGITRITKEATDGMQRWSDEKRADFCAVFDKRSKVSAYILAHTAEELLESAQRRQFVGTKAKAKLDKKYESVRGWGWAHDRDSQGQYDYRNVTIGGRSKTELDSIAESRAEEIFKNLPSLRSAVQLIRPEVATKIDKVEELKARVRELDEELESPELNEEIRLSQVDQGMTIAAFREMVKDRVARRKKLVAKLNDLTTEATELEDWIAKELFGGIPELSTAILDVAERHFERALGMLSTSRRVEERVKFGDSDSAVQMVKQFETDEQTISPTIKNEFEAALERLKLSAPIVRKALAEKKREKE